ncbi:MAG: serine/threonine protein kinase [Deltaproteobacteria bacterium]|nr:serine/threonine protein kinase [Deltaproteobacteria bacterium]
MIGLTVGNFRVIRKLGQGGMGEVLLAEHKDVQTKVAIKVLLPHISADKQHVQRFFNEAVAVGKIRHAGITKIFDVGFLADGTAYLVMELLEGESLAQRIERARRMPVEQVSDIARQITGVLEATHAQGIIHRDLKPDNIFLVPDSEFASGERVKILDFGIAKLGTSAMTQTGGAMGTPTYMSPEQWKNATKVDGRADLYSLGCLVFEMATGRPPFLAESIGELCNLHLNEAPPSVRSIVADVNPAFDAFVERLLAKDFQARPSVREAKALFTQLATEFRGVTAETMLPDGSMPELPASRAAHAVSRPVAPTTLGASASAMHVNTQPPAKRSKLFLGIGALVVAGVAGAFVARGAMGGGDDKPAEVGVAASAPPAEIMTPPPAPVPTPAPAAAPAPSAAPTPTPTPPAAAEVAMQRIRIATVPADAVVMMDDKVIANPFDERVAKSDVAHRIEVTAPGYKPESRTLTFDTNQVLVVTLHKEPAAAKVSTKPTTRPAPTPVKPVAKPSTPVVVTPPATSAPAPAATAPASTKPTYKGTKGTIITDYPPN